MRFDWMRERGSRGGELVSEETRKLQCGCKRDKEVPRVSKFLSFYHKKPMSLAQQLKAPKQKFEGFTHQVGLNLT